MTDKSYVTQSIVLGAEVRVEDRLYVADEMNFGIVEIKLDGGSAVEIYARSPAPLYALAKALVGAAGRLKASIEDSASASTPGADALGEGGPTSGERSGDPTVTGSAGTSSEPVAAPPPNSTEGGAS
jgi:hypothetical protein